MNGQPDDGYAYEAYPATAPGDDPDDEWDEDEDLAMQFSAYTAVASTNTTILMLNPCLASIRSPNSVYPGEG